MWLGSGSDNVTQKPVEINGGEVDRPGSSDMTVMPDKQSDLEDALGNKTGGSLVNCSYIDTRLAGLFNITQSVGYKLDQKLSDGLDMMKNLGYNLSSLGSCPALDDMRNVSFDSCSFISGKVIEKLALLETQLGAVIADTCKIENPVCGLDDKFDAVYNGLHDVKDQFDIVASHFVSVGRGVNAVDSRMDAVEAKLDVLDTKIEALHNLVMNQQTKKLDDKGNLTSLDCENLKF